MATIQHTGKFGRFGLRQAKFLITNIAFCSLIFLVFFSGVFSGYEVISNTELVMLGILFSLFSVGLVCTFLEKQYIVSHIANGLPIFALSFTGIGIFLAITGPTLSIPITPDKLILVFKEIGVALSPNILGVFLMAWLREMMFWIFSKEI